MDAHTVNEALGLPNFPSDVYNTKLKEMDMRWIWDSLAEKEYHGKVYWPTTECITSAYFSADTQRWVALIGQEIYPLGNLTYVTYPRALVVACAIRGMQLNVGHK